MPQAGTTGPTTFRLNALVHPFFRTYLLGNCTRGIWNYEQHQHQQQHQQQCSLLTLSIMCDKFLHYAQNVLRHTQNGHMYRVANARVWIFYKRSSKKICNICKLCSNFLFDSTFSVYKNILAKNCSIYFPLRFLSSFKKKRTTLIEHIIHTLTWLRLYHKTCQHMRTEMRKNAAKNIQPCTSTLMNE